MVTDTATLCNSLNIFDGADYFYQQSLANSRCAQENKASPLASMHQRSQFATLKGGRGQHRKYLPWVFTEHGAILAATLLSRLRAVQVSVYVVRAFVQPREFLAANEQLAR